MRNFFKIFVFVALLLAVTSFARNEISESCMKVYTEGGAPAVLESPACPQWSASYISQNLAQNCQFSTFQGRRKYQEDRVTCDLQFNVPVTGKDGLKDVEIGVAAIFDGHIGKEASELASKNLLYYFKLHVAFASYQQKFSCNSQTDSSSQRINSDMAQLCGDDDTFENIFKIALLRTIRDIDVKFTQEAISKNYVAGSTGTVVLLVDNQILVAHVGDTKAILCSRRSEIEGLEVEELTSDHRPNREDEKTRIDAASEFEDQYSGRRVSDWIAVTRAIGNLSMRRFGLISVPEVYGWRNLTVNDSFAVVASDGIFESLTPQEVCDLIEEKTKIPSSTTSSLANQIMKQAYKRGSGDNLSTIVVPLQSQKSSQRSAEGKDEL